MYNQDGMDGQANTVHGLYNIDRHPMRACTSKSIVDQHGTPVSISRNSPNNHPASHTQCLMMQCQPGVPCHCGNGDVVCTNNSLADAGPICVCAGMHVTHHACLLALHTVHAHRPGMWCHLLRRRGGVLQQPRQLLRGEGRVCCPHKTLKCMRGRFSKEHTLTVQRGSMRRARGIMYTWQGV